MGALSALAQFISKGAPFATPMNDPFVQLDRSAISEKLKLRERGQEQGLAGLPPSDMSSLDGVEADIAVEISEHYSRAQIEAANSLRTYDGRLGDLVLLSKLSSIGAEAQRAVGDFRTEVVNCNNRLANSRTAIVDSYRELATFRAENDLTRPAHEVPPSVSTLGYIILAWFLETAMNAFLLRLNDDMGYLGGVIAAATVGAINVLASAFVGRMVWPYKNVRDRQKRALTWLIIALWVCFVLVWNLMAAHFRDAKSAGAEHPEQVALTLLGSGLDSIYSWGLLIAGIIFAVTAARAGYRMDDPYPSYGQISRRHDARCEDYASEVERATQGLQEIRDEGIDEAMAVRERLEQQMAERNQIIAARKAFAQRFAEYGDQLEQLANALLQDYRAANMKARSDPPPAHFKTTWVLPRQPLSLAAPPEVPLGAVEQAEAALERAVAEITAAFEVAIGQFEPLDNLRRRLADG
jgi:hypothetical protein